jgi:hypothetical protein
VCVCVRARDESKRQSIRLSVSVSVSVCLSFSLSLCSPCKRLDWFCFRIISYLANDSQYAVKDSKWKPMHNDNTFWCTSDFVFFIKRSQEMQALEKYLIFTSQPQQVFCTSSSQQHALLLAFLPKLPGRDGSRKRGRKERENERREMKTADQGAC